MKPDQTSSRVVGLNGEWQLRWYDGLRGDQPAKTFSPTPELGRVIPAQVPGSVHLDLMRAGILEEPNLGLNVLKARWVQENFWIYRKTFQHPGLGKGERAWLFFETLDLVGVIYLNGVEVGRHANAFYPCRVEVTQALQAGENIIVVQLESGLIATAEKPSSGFHMNNIDAIHKRNWLRTTQSTFGWDWSPLLLNVGIRGEVRLEIASLMHLEDASVCAELSADLQTGSLRSRLFVEGLSEKPVKGTLRMQVGEQSFEKTLELQPGKQCLEITGEIEKPDLWWPVGHGAQPLYPVTLTFSAQGQMLQVQRKVGFRHVEVDQSPHPQKGRYFIFRINGKPIFCKGGNLVPADIILARIDRERDEMLTDRALEANCNLLRIWGGGLYETDAFYEACDRKGILVWQEFIFACAKYPTTDELLHADIKREARYQVRRLASHPSLVAWCGNNEMEWGAWAWGYEKGVVLPDYAIFHLVLPRILKEEDGTRYYQPSSPFSPDLEMPNDDFSGDQHPWSIGFVDMDFRKYREMPCRFPNEGGFLGSTALPTLRECLVGTAGNPFHTEIGAQASFAWEQHDNSIAQSSNMSHCERGMREWLGVEPGDFTLEEYAFYAGLLQGQALEEYIRNFRRRMFDTSSAIFWMYNDVWPATRSWTIVDYYGRRTPSFQPVRRAFQPLRCAVVQEGDEVRVYGINEGPIWRGNLHYGLANLNGSYAFEAKRRVVIPENESIVLASFPLSVWENSGFKKSVGFAQLFSARKVIAQDVLILPLYREMEWQDAIVNVRVRNGEAHFSCPVFAWRVCIDLDGEKPLADNFFDLLPGVSYAIPWDKAWGRPRILAIGNQIAVTNKKASKKGTK